MTEPPDDTSPYEHHTVVHEHNPATKQSRWTCQTCDWTTPWRHLYTDATAGAAAVRHTTGTGREDDP